MLPTEPFALLLDMLRCHSFLSPLHMLLSLLLPFDTRPTALLLALLGDILRCHSLPSALP